MQIDVTRGWKWNESGTILIRVGKSNELMVSDAMPRYYDAVNSGSVFSISNAVTALGAGVSPLSAGGTPFLALYNPANSGKNIVIIKAGGIITANGTVSPQGLVYNFGVNQTITATENATPISNLLNIQTRAGCVGKGFSNTALTGSGALTLLRPCVGAGNATAQTAFASYLEDIAGEWILPPSSVFAIVPLTSATGASASGGIVWMEVPIG